MTVRKKKRKPSELSKLKKRLARLHSEIAAAETELAKSRLLIQVAATEAKIKVEMLHKVSGFNRLRYYEIPAGAPGLGKRS
ncbi:hypothetical protein [Comamonas sp. MYb396]|uniref:hypothetical protein n=1 Tax=Comamonas sp. MYb396 TaxID=2745302 RepID=UPI0030ADA4FD